MARTATLKNPSAKSNFSLKKDIEAIRDDTEELATHAYSAVRNAANEAVEDVAEQRDELIESIGNYVAERPFQTIGIAAAAGFILAKLWR